MSVLQSVNVSCMPCGTPKVSEKHRFVRAGPMYQTTYYSQIVRNALVSTVIFTRNLYSSCGSGQYCKGGGTSVQLIASTIAFGGDAVCAGGGVTQTGSHTRPVTRPVTQSQPMPGHNREAFLNASRAATAAVILTAGR